jgi:arabinoxylan arabinofuranohydrolase
MVGRSLKLRLVGAVSVVSVAAGYPTESLADNPIVQTIYTADPAPMVYDGHFYVYSGHDEDTLVNDFFTMNEWRVYSSADMVNWTDHGTPLKYSDFSWARSNAWAAQAIYRNGNFYFYVTTAQGIGVAVSTSPTGPFKDAIGKALISNSGCGDIDPTVFIDDDG